MRELWLDDNRLTTLPAGIFDGLRSLRELRLGINCLHDLPAGYFDGHGFDVDGLNLQDDVSSCNQPDSEGPEPEEPEARSVWRGWRLILLNAAQAGESDA